MTKVRIEGLRELEQQLQSIKVGTGRAALRRALDKAAEPLARAARQKAPRREGDLSESIDVSGVALPKDRKQSEIERFVGPARNKPYGIMQEFGTWFHAAQPFMRPAWDASKDKVLDELKFSLFEEVTKTVKRVR